MGEPKFGFKNLTAAKREGKVRAFFNLILPTESFGNVEIAGFKVVEGEKGLFISLPNRAVQTTERTTVNTESGQVEGTTSGVKYYNNIRFESKDKYNEFRKELNDVVLPMITEKLAK